MYTKAYLSLLLLFTYVPVVAQSDVLGGFRYVSEQSPSGNEWQSPEQLALNKEQPHAYMFHFADVSSAQSVLPDASSYVLSLDGTWKFRWVPSPEKRPVGFASADYDLSGWDDIAVPGCWNMQGLNTDGTMKYGVPIYVNQPVIFYHQVAVDDWRKGVMRVPADTLYTTWKYPNEVGSYRRSFTVPKEWKGRRLLINFDGVDSFFYLWVNGHYVGFSKNSRNTATFDITQYVFYDKTNSVSLEVYRSSDGSFLEAQDMFRLPGIIRSVYLTSVPENRISDMAVRTASLNDEAACIDIRTEIVSKNEKDLRGATISYDVYEIALYSDDVTGRVASGVASCGDAREGVVRTALEVPHPKAWSAEEPHRYVLVAKLLDKRGRILDCTSTYFGVRTVEIKEMTAQEDEFGNAGRYFLVNGKPVKLKGVNRHETNPTTGHAITRQQMTEEVMLMKRANINHVRLSHYPNHPYFYYLADKYGLYLEDEANIESHEYYYGEASLSHPVEWRDAHVARNMEMVRAHVNAPSIVIWSLGNEAGPGNNFVEAYKAIKAFDTSRPVQYERNNDIVDMGSNQYPSVAWVQQVAKGKSNVKYPYHISEYAHSMGNSLGNLADYWKAMESSNYFCGAAIWDWVDQAMDTYTPSGLKYMGYGGDHGDWPNDGMFCMNGIMLPDLTPKPQYFEVKKVYQNVGIESDFEHNAVRIFNKNYFTSLRDYLVRWILVKDGREESSGEFITDRSIHGPRSSKLYRLPFNIMDLPCDGEYFLNVELSLGKDMPWARKGYVQMSEQLECTPGEYDMTQPTCKGHSPLVVDNGPDAITITGDAFSLSFNNADGSISKLVYAGEDVIEPGCGPRIDAFRAPVDNDNWAWSQWFQNGLYDLRHYAVARPVVVNNPDGSVSIIYSVRSQAPAKGSASHRPGKAGEPFEEIVAGDKMEEDDFHFLTTQRYTVYADGNICVASSVISSDPSVVLPRLGYVMKLPKEFDNYAYYGRGPLNNYADRKTGSFIGLYTSKVEEQFVNFPKPQSMGNREDVRWCALTNGQGTGLQIVANNASCSMSASALPWSALQLTLAAHPHELPQSDGTYLHIDCQVTGLGGNSCGQGGPLADDRVKGALHQVKFIIRPVHRGAELTSRSQIVSYVPCPVSISRDRAGNVTIQGDTMVMDPSTICYQIQEPGMRKTGKVQVCSDSKAVVPMRNGGTVSAWYKGDSRVKTIVTFQRIESVPVEIVYVSSEEGPDGAVARNLLDGDPSTIWHTMYSITVPKYPHWIDFDCGEQRLLKGFSYMPRQDGSANGNIKAYKIEVSNDGQTWGDIVAQGEFDNSRKVKKVLFDKPCKARFVRFTALSSQDGQDFASGAEMTFF